jgi:hypothetical protein
MELGAQSLADRRRDRRQFPGELVDRVAETIAEARLRKQCPHALDGAVEAIGENAPDPIRGLLLGRGALELAIGFSKGCRTGGLGVAQMPEHTAADNCGQIHLLGETAAVLFIGQDIGG